MTARSYSNQEAKKIAGIIDDGMPGETLNRNRWAYFVDANVDESAIEQALALFNQVSPDLQGLEALCKFVESSPEPNRLIASGVISCRIAPGVSGNGLVQESGRLNVGTCWNNGWKLILNPRGADLTLTFGVREIYSLALTEERYQEAKRIIENWGNRIAGKRVASAA